MGAVAILGFVTIWWTAQTCAQEPGLADHRSTVERQPAYTGPQPFDMLHYRLDATLAMDDARLGGTCTMTMVLTGAVDSVALNEVALTIDSVAVNGRRAVFSVLPAEEAFVVRFGEVQAPGDTVQIRVFYRRDPAVPRDSSRLGYYFYPTGSGNPANLGYTMSEPSDARCWMPCYDEPWDKATAEINATVPAGYVAASNGRLVNTTANPGGTVTWRWREDHQIATYLMCITASRFAVPSLSYMRGPNDTIPVQYYVFRPDSAAAAQYLPTVRVMVEAFGARFGPYPFDKYGMAGVQPFGFGGMEHQTLTTMHRAYQTNENVVSHELTHQWWGDLVTCGTWADIWLNESFASYGEALWKESQGGAQALKDYMARAFLHLTATSWRYAVYDPEGQGQYLFSDAVYSKGAWVLHTLRGVLGDTLFFRSLRAYRDRFAGRSATTREFEAVVDSVAGTSMAWFFDQWVFNGGWPEYSSTFSWARDTLVLTMIQSQTAPQGYTGAPWPFAYRMPIQVRASAMGKDTLFTVIDTLRQQTFRVPIGFAPQSVVVDPEMRMLRRIVTPAAGIADGAAPALFALEQNYPNPFNPVTTIRYSLPSPSEVRLEVYDLLGRLVRVLDQGRRSAGEHTVQFGGDGLASGLYIYRLAAGSFRASRTMLLVK